MSFVIKVMSSFTYPSVNKFNKKKIKKKNLFLTYNIQNVFVIRYITAVDSLNKFKIK